MHRLNQIQELISKVQCAMTVRLLIRTSVSVKMNKLATVSKHLSSPGEQAAVKKEDVWDRQAWVGKPIAQVRLPHGELPIKHYSGAARSKSQGFSVELVVEYRLSMCI